MACDCPCDDLVDVETPKIVFMELSYIAQAIVVTIVGFNMGFKYAKMSHERGDVCGGQAAVAVNIQNYYDRKDYLDVWKKQLLIVRKNKVFSTKIAAQSSTDARSSRSSAKSYRGTSEMASGVASKVGSSVASESSASGAEY